VLSGQMKTKKCSACGVLLTHVIFDWLQRLPWCKACWLEHLRDFRAAQE
jgi:hypothetical protein